MSEVTRLKSENTPYVKYGGHIIGNLGVYLNSLHMAQFSEVFHKCAQFDFCPLIERMVIHPTFNRIPTSALLSVIEIAAKNGQVKALTFIMNAPRAKELDREAKRQAFELAALEGQKEALQTFLS